MDDLIFQAALSLHAAGFIVCPFWPNKIPCIEPLKGGYRERWKREGQSRAEVETLFGEEPRWGLAIETYPTTNIVGIDCDGPDGVSLLASLNITFPETYKEQTPRGGTHLLFDLPTEIPHGLQRKVRVVGDNCGWGKDGCGVDFLISGFILVAPSPRYVPTNNSNIINRAIIPTEFLNLVSKKSNEDAEAPDAEWVQTLLNGPVPHGERNHAGIRLGGHFIKLGYEKNAIKTILHPWSKTKCVPPMSDAEWKSLWKGILGLLGKDAQKSVSEEMFSHEWTAVRFAELAKPRCRYLQPAKAWMIYNGQLWEPDTTLAVQRIGIEVVRQIIEEAHKETGRERRKQLMEMALKLESRGGFEAMIDMARKHLAIHPDEFDRDMYLFNVQNGTLDLRTGILRPHDPDDFITKISATSYDPNARCPLFDAFLDEIFPGGIGKQKQDFMDEKIGGDLTGDVGEHVFMMWHGSGANAKGTYAKVLSKVFGTYYRGAPSDLFIQKKGVQHEEQFHHLRGCRLAVVSETSRTHVVDTGKLKLHVSTDLVTSRGMYKDREQYVPQYSILWMTNFKPRVYESGTAMWRRVILISFHVTIPENRRILNYEERFADELPGILARYVRGCVRWWNRRQETGRGLIIPEVVAKDVAAYRRESDAIGDFIARRCLTTRMDEKLQAKEPKEPIPHADILREVTRKEFHKELRAFIDTSGRKWKPRAVEVVEYLRGEGYEEATRKGVRWWIGIGLVPHGGENLVEEVEIAEESTDQENEGADGAAV